MHQQCATASLMLTLSSTDSDVIIAYRLHPLQDV